MIQHNLPIPEPPLESNFEEVTTYFVDLYPGSEELGLVPRFRFEILNEAGDPMGHISVRVGDNQHVRFAAGHLGYEIKEPYRGHHFAGKACLALAPWIFSFMDNVLITADPDNDASIRTMIWIGAQFLDEVDVPEGDPHYRRGSRRKVRYSWTHSHARPWP